MPWASSRSSVSVTWASVAQLVEHLRRRRRIGVEQRRAKPSLTASATRCCWAPSWRLRSICAAALVGRGDDAGARGDELLVAHLQLVEAGLQGGVEAHVVQGEAELAGEVGEHAVLLLVERRAVARTLDDDEPQQVAEVGDRGHAHERSAATGEQRRHPHRSQALPDTWARASDRRSSAPRSRRGAARSGTETVALEHAVAAGPHLGRVERHRLAQRLGQLEQQLVHRDGA